MIQRESREINIGIRVSPAPRIKSGIDKHAGKQDVERADNREVLVAKSDNFSVVGEKSHQQMTSEDNNTVL